MKASEKPSAGVSIKKIDILSFNIVAGDKASRPGEHDYGHDSTLPSTVVSLSVQKCVATARYAC